MSQSFCMYCVGQTHRPMLTGYCLTVCKCDRCGRVTDLAMVEDIAMLKVGDAVEWRGAWGALPSARTTITHIEVCRRMDKYGDEKPQVSWDLVRRHRDQDDHVVVGLSNGHWAYGHQLARVKGESR